MKKHKKQKKSTKASTKSSRKKMLGGSDYFDSLDEVVIGMAFYDEKKTKDEIYSEFSTCPEDKADIDAIIKNGPPS